MQLLPALEAGGVERSTLEIAAALSAAGHRAIVVSAGGRLQPELLAAGAEHRVLDVGRKSPLSLRHVARLRRWFADPALDLVHARSRFPAWLAWLAWRGLRRPRPRLLTTVHGLNSPGRYSAILLRGERVICVSETVRAHLLRHYPATDPQRLVVIRRGIDPAAFPRGLQPDAQWRERWRAGQPSLAGRRVLLLPGRGTRLKGHDTALVLLAALRARGHDLALWMPGAEQPDRAAYASELRARAEALGVAQAVAIEPPRRDLAECYAVADLVLQLSARPEAFGRTVLEALAIGRPVAGFAHGGVGELLDELYPSGAVAPGDDEALLATCERLLASPPPPPDELSRYSLARMQARTLALYAELAGG
ncbi:MAG TPA: glycosyltransferase [Xanthomonadaceae bacterium]|nr:glycosyltransferase [Xanthomonadaceae bacterium]